MIWECVCSLKEKYRTVIILYYYVTEVVDYLTAKGRKVGLVKVHLYRPFSTKYLLKVLPRSVKRIAVLDRTKENGALGEPLYLDIVSALFAAGKRIKVIGGRIIRPKPNDNILASMAYNIIPDILYSLSTRFINSTYVTASIKTINNSNTI